MHSEHLPPVSCTRCLGLGGENRIYAPTLSAQNAKSRLNHRDMSDKLSLEQTGEGRHEMCGG